MSSSISGTMSSHESPDWLPLERFLQSDDLCDHFMWMFDVILVNGMMLKAYKHRMTRRYLHLEADGSAYRYCGGNRYHAISTRCALLEVFDTPGVWEPTPSAAQALRIALEHSQT